MINTQFEEGQKVYYPWFNSQMGKFIVLDRQFTKQGRCGVDKYDIMLCKTWQEASDFADALNGKIVGIIEGRKMEKYIEKMKTKTKGENNGNAWIFRMVC